MADSMIRNENSRTSFIEDGLRGCGVTLEALHARIEDAVAALLTIAWGTEFAVGAEERQEAASMSEMVLARVREVHRDLDDLARELGGRIAGTLGR